MKKKIQRLVLHRETIRDLAEGTLPHALGGALTDTCPRRCSVTCLITGCCPNNTAFAFCV
jgi:hypothetical protein